MRRFILLFTFLFAVSSSFLACKDAEREAGETDIMEEEMETDVYEEDEDGFGVFDANDDDMLDKNEFGEAYDEDWTTWDADADGYLNDDEFYDTYYGWVDADNDDLIDEDEWNEGYNNLYGDYGAVGDFGDYDLDDDGFLDDDEWFEGWGDSDWFNDYDLDDDGLVDNDEWDDGIFGLWDEDDDEFWDEDEYNTYSVYYDTW